MLNLIKTGYVSYVYVPVVPGVNLILCLFYIDALYSSYGQNYGKQTE